MKENNRNPALDIVRIVATFCVISFHCVGGNGLYEVYMIGTRMYLLSILHAATMVCVPLFIMLTGYLMRKKHLSRKFYKGIVKTLSIYVLAAIVCDPGEILCRGMEGLAKLTSGRGTGYSWYVGMYMGLFLMIPFLNVMYRGDFADPESEPAKKYKRTLISSLLCLTALPGSVNIFVFTREWWKNPTISSDYLEIVITFWKSMYPITYYMIGCFLSEYGLKLRRRTCGLLLGAVTILNGTYSFMRSCGLEYAGGTWLSYGSLTIVIQSVLVFNWIAAADTKNYPEWLKTFLKHISDLCFGAYLVSQLFEEYFYPMFRRAIPSVGYRISYYPLMIGLVFVCSLMLSALLNLVYEIFNKLVKYMAGKMRTQAQRRGWLISK